MQTKEAKDAFKQPDNKLHNGAIQQLLRKAISHLLQCTLGKFSNILGNFGNILGSDHVLSNTSLDQNKTFEWKGWVGPLDAFGAKRLQFRVILG